MVLINTNLFSFTLYNFTQSVRFRSRQEKNHYETLNLPPNCSSKDIKESFIKLSKQFHPDRNDTKDSHATYVKIVEAYSVLSKPDSRRMYDLSLSSYQYSPRSGSANQDYQNYTYSNRYARRSPEDNYQTARMKYRARYYNDFYSHNRPPRPKLSNRTVVLISIFITVSGMALQLLAIRYSRTFKRDQLIRRSQENELILREIRENVALNGNEKQIDKLEKRLISNGS